MTIESPMMTYTTPGFAGALGGIEAYGDGVAR